MPSNPESNGSAQYSASYPASSPNGSAYDAGKSRPELSPEPVDKRPIIIGAVVAGVFLLLFIGLGVFFFTHPVATAILRDIFIIFMGLGVFIVILLLIILIVIIAYLVIKINDLFHLLDREIRPMLVKLNDTLGNVRGTTSFISEQAVKPVISTASSISAINAIFRSLFRRN
jgi:predicted PurR-regulated permease PerM